MKEIEKDENSFEEKEENNIKEKQKKKKVKKI